MGSSFDTLRMNGEKLEMFGKFLFILHLEAWNFFSPSLS